MFAEEKPFCRRCRWNRFATISMASARCISMVASRWKLLTMERRRAGLGDKSGPPRTDLRPWGDQVHVQWDAMYVRLLDPRTGELLREHLSGKRGGHRIRDADPGSPTTGLRRWGGESPPSHSAAGASTAGSCTPGRTQYRRCLRCRPPSSGRDRNLPH
jgi:hypothetical protein